MSYVFEADGVTVWSPARRVAEVYEGFVNVLSTAFDQPTGFSHNGEDYVKVDPGVLAAFVRRLLTESTGHRLLADQVRPVLGPSVVMLDRCGAALSADTPDEVDALDEARKTAASMPA